MSVLNYVYDVTVKSFAGLVFLVMGAVIGISMIGAIWMRIDFYKKGGETGEGRGLSHVMSSLGIGLGLGMPTFLL